MEEFSEHFKSWLSGFIDGEGNFYLEARQDGKFFIAKFRIGIRADEIQIIKKIKKYWGGSIHYYNPSIQVKNANMAIMYQLCGIKKLFNLIRHLDNYPLLAKKQGDYKIWREAIILLAQKEHLNGRYGYILHLCNRLKKIREYREQLEIDLLPPEIEDKQLYFDTKEGR